MVLILIAISIVFLAFLEKAGIIVVSYWMFALVDGIIIISVYMYRDRLSCFLAKKCPFTFCPLNRDNEDQYNGNN